jgi:hypothetical protein
LIEFERGDAAAERKRQRLYFFDFDKTLTFVPGLTFAFLSKKSKTLSAPTTEIPPSERILLSQYAKYLFSDYCGEEPTESSGGNGRMNLLRELFTVIGKNRIFIVTANKTATNVPNNPYYIYFKFLISELLPDFLEDHIIGVYPTIEAPLVNSKQDAIARILQRSPGGTVASKSPKKSPRSPRSPSHGHGGGRKISRKPYHRNRRSSLRRSTRKRRN